MAAGLDGLIDEGGLGALVRLCFQAGASDVTLGEAWGMEETSKALAATGIAATARAAGARVIASRTASRARWSWQVGGQSIPIPVPSLEADVIISACKGKTHHRDPVSGTIKNRVGAIPLTLRMKHHDATRSPSTSS